MADIIYLILYVTPEMQICVCTHIINTYISIIGDTFFINAIGDINIYYYMSCSC